jgi:transposase
MSVIAVLGLKGVIAPMVYKGSMDGELFCGYIEQFLAPVMKRGDTLILDSLSAHKVSGAFDSLVEKGVMIKFQPVILLTTTPSKMRGQKSKLI